MLKTAGTGSAPRGRVTVVPEAPQTYPRVGRLANRPESYTAGRGAFSTAGRKPILGRYLTCGPGLRRTPAAAGGSTALTPIYSEVIV